MQFKNKVVFFTQKIYFHCQLIVSLIFKQIVVLYKNTTNLNPIPSLLLKIKKK